MNVPPNIEYPDAMNADTRASIVGWKVQEILDFLRNKYPEENVVMENLKNNLVAKQLGLKEGVKRVETPRGPRYFKNSRMIKASEAFE